MITPLDIQNKEFGKGVRGYKEEEVDGFLDLLTVDLENLLSENLALKSEVKRLTADLDSYKNTEKAMLETLEGAKSLMRDIAISSEKRAEILLKNAELDAKLITREAEESVERLKEESIYLENRVATFRNKFKNMLEAELEKMDLLSYELFESITETNDDIKVDRTASVQKSESSKDNFVNTMEAEVDNLKETIVNLKIDEK